jgi:FkbM family methyltransferase
MTSYSQFGEDDWILKHLPLPTKGVFVEVGAYDGISSSNTYGFEREGWSGLCIEPDNEVCKSCRVNRQCLTLCRAVGTEEGNGVLFVNPYDRGTSSLMWRPDWLRVDVFISRLDQILRNFCIVDIDILSIDTEGTELDVWESIGPIRPRIVIMEFWTQPQPPRDKGVVSRMAKSGYTEVHRTTANLIFTKG